MQVTTSGATFEWDEARRIVTARFRSTAETPMIEREKAARKIRAWTGKAHYGVLAIREDESGGPRATGATAPIQPLSELGLGALAFWAGFFRLSPGGVRIAAVGFTGAYAQRLEEWSTKYELDLRLFDTGDEARAHLGATP